MRTDHLLPLEPNTRYTAMDWDVIKVLVAQGLILVSPQLSQKSETLPITRQPDFIRSRSAP